MFSDFNRLYPHNSTTSLVDGDVYKIRATVNRHSMNTSKYNSTGPVRETVFNRPKIGEYIGNKNESYRKISTSKTKIKSFKSC